MTKSNIPKIKKPQNIYLDYASGYMPNSSSIHMLGVEAKNKLDLARKSAARVLNARAKEIIFTSGGTESNNLAIQGVVLKNQGKILPHIITTNIEHASVLETFKSLEKRKLAQISILGVNEKGLIDLKLFRKTIKKNTVLVSVMYANNEIGTIQPISEIAKEIRHFNKLNNKNVLFHIDAVQAVNYLDLNVEILGVDLLSLSGAKISGAGRVGLLYKRFGVEIVPIMFGGDQEFGLRPGTENISAVISFVDALFEIQKIKEKETKRLTILRDYFISNLDKIPFNIKINGDLVDRLPNNINITVPNIPSDLLVIELSARGIMSSSKSACKIGDGKASHVIKAINPKLKDTDGSIRFSMGGGTTKKDIDFVLKSLGQILTKLKKWYD